VLHHRFKHHGIPRLPATSGDEATRTHEACRIAAPPTREAVDRGERHLTKPCAAEPHRSAVDPHHDMPGPNT
jgi:hypothetical protein